MPELNKPIGTALRSGYSVHGLMMEVPGNHYFLAQQYLLAAEILMSAPEEVDEMKGIPGLRKSRKSAPIPLFFCIAQAIELFLKSFLGALGNKPTRAWRQHDIAALLREALGSGLQLSEPSKNIIQEVGQQGTELRFMDRRGVIQMPPERRMIATAEELKASVVRTVRPFIRVRGEPAPGGT